MATILLAPGSAHLSPVPPLPAIQYHSDLYAAEDDPRLILPPTPDTTPVPAERDFFGLFHGQKLGNELHQPHHPPQHHQHTVNYFPGDLHSPFVPGAPEGLCEGFIKPEFPGGFKCSPMTMPTLPQESPMASFLDTTPLTPQSSHYSSSSPLSHVSTSPEPYPSELDSISLAPSIHHHVGSPSSNPPTSVCSTAAYQQHNGGIVLAQGHVNDLDIVHSLELITGNGSTTVSATGAVSDTYHSTSSASSCSASPVHDSYGQYEFELLQLMSNPDDLLADPKVLLHPTAAPTPIH